MPAERNLEKRLIRYCKDKGIYIRKFTSPGNAGVPDRVMVGPKGTVFLELKSPGKRPTRLQLVEINRIIAAGGRAFWADAWEGARAAAACCIEDTSAEDDLL